MKINHIAIILGIAALAIALVIVRLDSVPPLWWDEGWTLTVARHWVEDGHYGQYLSGEPAPRGLEAAFPVVASVAASFRLFGVGVWQGRIVGSLFTLASLGVIYLLSRYLYNPSVAVGTLFVAIFLTGHPHINPLINGRQVLADIPVVFFLLVGFVCLYWAWDHPLIFVPLASLFWGIAIVTKAQALPFWGLSLVVPLLPTLWFKRWRTAGILLSAGSGAWIASRLMGELQGVILRGHSLPAEPVDGLLSLVAFVPDLRWRVYALEIVLIFALLLVCGLAWAGWVFLKGGEWERMDQRKSVLKLSLLSLAGGWFAWYLLLSNGGERYLASPALVSCIFAASMLYDLSDGYNIRATLGKAGGILPIRKPDQQKVLTDISPRHSGDMSYVRRLSQATATFLLILLAVYSLSIAIFTYVVTWQASDTSASQIASHLNRSSASLAIVESYDSEIFFFLERPYHFPPDSIHGALLRRYVRDPDHTIDYDPLAADPDYLVVGPTGDKWQLYDQVLEGGSFDLVTAIGAYSIYERHRP